MNPIGNVKGFIIDVMMNIAIVFGVGYMGGSLVSLTHLNNSTLDEMLPIDLEKSPYVGEKAGFSLTGYSFPYTLYTPGHPGFLAKVMNWLISTSLIIFVTLRKSFRSIASINTTKWYMDLLLFYIVPLILVTIAVYARSLTSMFVILITLYSMFAGEYLFQEDKMKNGLWYGLAPISFWYTVFFMKMETGLMNLLLKMFLSFIAFLAGCFCVFVLYPLWWSTCIAFAILYYMAYLFFSPIWYGFDKIVEEMAKHRLTLMILFMILTIHSSKSFLVSLATAGIVAGSIYMLYLLFKNKTKK